MILVEITEAKDMLSSIKSFIPAIEKMFDTSPKNISKYSITFAGHLAHPIITGIKDLYTKGGWKVVNDFSDWQGKNQTTFTFTHK
jgi:hypothetical protein